MDEEKLNELFRTILENKLSTGPPSYCGSSSSDIASTLNSSLGEETYLTYDDTLRELNKVLSNMNYIQTDLEQLIEQSKSGFFK